MGAARLLRHGVHAGTGTRREYSGIMNNKHVGDRPAGRVTQARQITGMAESLRARVDFFKE